MSHIFALHIQTSQLMMLAQEHSDEMEGRFNQNLPESLQAAFKKAMNFEPCISTMQTINTRRMNKVNQIDVTQCDDEFEVNEAHI